MGVTYSQEAAAALGAGGRQHAGAGKEDAHASAGRRNKPPRHWREFVKQAAKWNLKDLKRARARFAAQYEESGTFLIGRRQFWEIFTDYDFTLVKNGEFLSLPLDVFGYFEQDDSGIVDLREVFCVMALVAQGPTMSERLELCFPLFGPSMTEERVAQFLLTLQRALFRLGVLAKRASPAAVMTLAARICGEGAWRKCQTVSAQLLGDWLASSDELQAIVGIVLAAETQKAMQYSLLRSNAEIKSAGSVMKREARKLVNSLSAPGASAAGRSTALGAVRQTNARPRGSTAEVRQTQSAARSPTLAVASAASNAAKASFVAPAAAADGGVPKSSSTPAAATAAAARGERRASLAETEDKIGKALSKEDLEDMIATEDAEAAAAIAKFDPRDLVHLRKSWNNARSAKKGLTKDQFFSVMHTQFPSITSAAVLGRMFVLFDRDRDGMINFDEFIIGVSRLTSGSLEEKARFLFDVANAAGLAQVTSKVKNATRATTYVPPPATSGDGEPQAPAASSASGEAAEGAALDDASKIENAALEAAKKTAAALQSAEPERSMRLVDLVKLVQDTNNELMECAHLVELIITMMDYDKNGSVEHHEFERAVAEIPTILSSFDECLKPPEDLAVWTLKLLRAVPHFNASSILNAWRRLGRMREQYLFATWEQFVNFIEPIWEGSAFSPKDTMTSRRQSSFDFSQRASTELSLDTAVTSDELVYTVLLNIFRVALHTCPAREDDENFVLPGDEQVDLRKMLIGMVLALERSPQVDAECPKYHQQKGELYFELFDSDCSKSVDYQEFFEFLYASQLSMQDTGWRAIELLRSLDINHDGVVTFTEFMEAVRENKDILYCFGRIFHASVIEDVDGGPAATPLEPLGESAIQEHGDSDAVAGEETHSKVTTTSSSSSLRNNNYEEEESKEVESEETPDVDANSKTPTLGQSASQPAGLLRNKPPLQLSISVSAPALPLTTVYRTTYHFPQKVEQPPSPATEGIAPLPSVRSKMGRKNTLLNSRRSPTNRDLKSPKSPGTARSSVSANSHRGTISLEPLS